MGGAYSPPRRGGVARQLNRSWRAGREARARAKRKRDSAQPQEKHEASIEARQNRENAGLTTPSAPLRWLRGILLRAQPPLLCELNFTATWLRRYSGAGSVKRWTGGEYSVHFGCGIEALKTAPESLRSRRSIALAAQVTTHSSDHPRCTVERRRLLRREWASGGVTAEGLPFFVCEIHGAGQVGHFAG